VPSADGRHGLAQKMLCVYIVGRSLLLFVQCLVGDSMKRSTVALGIALAVALTVIPGQSVAASRPIVHATETQILFRLQVSGLRNPAATYWVAYGPLRGRFGIKRLRPAANGLFEASQWLPLHLRTTFAYVAGYGVMRTRAGLAPGNPVITIRVFGPAVIAPGGIPVVRWNTPIG